jgi:hypothetical protein
MKSYNQREDGMRLVAIIATLVVATATQTASPAAAQALAEKMTCEQLIRAFEVNGVIYKRVNGTTIPVRAGIPIRQARGLNCGPNNYQRRTGSARTTDKPRCIYSVYCQGFGNDKLFRNQ